MKWGLGNLPGGGAGERKKIPKRLLAIKVFNTLRPGHEEAQFQGN